MAKLSRPEWLVIYGDKVLNAELNLSSVDRRSTSPLSVEQLRWCGIRQNFLSANVEKKQGWRFVRILKFPVNIIYLSSLIMPDRQLLLRCSISCEWLWCRYRVGKQSTTAAESGQPDLCTRYWALISLACIKLFSATVCVRGACKCTLQASPSQLPRTLQRSCSCAEIYQQCLYIQLLICRDTHTMVLGSWTSPRRTDRQNSETANAAYNLGAKPHV